MSYPSDTPHPPRFRFNGVRKIVVGLPTLLALSLPASAQQLALRASAQPVVANALEMVCWHTRSPCVSGGEGPIRKAIAQAARESQAPPSVAGGGSDGRFQIVLGAFITAAGTDIAMTMYHVGTGTVRERGFGAWWQDSPVAFAVTKSAVTALFAYQLQKLHKTRPKTAMVLGFVDTAIEASLVARTTRLGSRAQ